MIHVSRFVDPIINIYHAKDANTSGPKPCNRASTVACLPQQKLKRKGPQSAGPRQKLFDPAGTDERRCTLRGIHCETLPSSSLSPFAIRDDGGGPSLCCNRTSKAPVSMAASWSSALDDLRCHDGRKLGARKPEKSPFANRAGSVRHRTLRTPRSQRRQLQTRSLRSLAPTSAATRTSMTASPLPCVECHLLKNSFGQGPPGSVRQLLGGTG
ncbi:hypothetical protein BS78_05G170800 [Paspalum vaginatum]|nr:hypothetical protein BS78_05G170800 [Paspalum vaginatum]